MLKTRLQKSTSTTSLMSSKFHQFFQPCKKSTYSKNIVECSYPTSESTKSSTYPSGSTHFPHVPQMSTARTGGVWRPQARCHFGSAGQSSWAMPRWGEDLFLIVQCWFFFISFSRVINEKYTSYSTYFFIFFQCWLIICNKEYLMRHDSFRFYGHIELNEFESRHLSASCTHSQVNDTTLEIPAETALRILIQRFDR